MLATMPPRRKRIPQHPLRLWREREGLSQGDLARACHLTQAMISFIESGLRIPQGKALEDLRAFTGLPTDAFVRAEYFLQEEPDFLRKYRRPSKVQPRRRRQPPPEA